jgi:hypothetical protein
MSIKPFLEIIVSRVDNTFVAEVQTAGHFVDCPLCREASVIAAMRAVTNALEEAEKRNEDTPEERAFVH